MAPPLKAQSTAPANKVSLMFSPKWWTKATPTSADLRRPTDSRETNGGLRLRRSRQRRELQLAERHDLVLADHLVFGVRAQPLVPDLVDLAGLVHRQERLVDLREQCRLVLLHPDTDRLESHRIVDHLELGSRRPGLVD